MQTDSPIVESPARETWPVIVEEILAEIRPALEEHGGGAKLLAIEGNTIRLSLQGSCAGCPMSAMTFGVMVDDMIKERIPAVEEVQYA